MYRCTYMYAPLAFNIYCIPYIIICYMFISLQNDLSLWQAPVCLNFLDELLTWVKSTVAEDSEKYVLKDEYSLHAYMYMICESISIQLACCF